MTITSVVVDAEAATLTVIADFTVPLSRLWDGYVDPRQIERFWGPPGYPSRFLRHDVRVGGRSDYRMTGPNGELSAGYWEWLSVEPGHSFTVRDGFAHDDGTPNDTLPTMQMASQFSATDAGSRVVTTTTFGSPEQLAQLLEMGMEIGMRAAMEQIDAVLADEQSYSADRATEVQPLTDTQLRITRVLRGSLRDVWDAHTNSAVVPRWQLGPEGWVMDVCETGTTVGDRLRSEWRDDMDSERFGFTGAVLDSAAPRWLVTTERMVTPEDPEGTQSPELVYELTLTEISAGTLLSYVVTYPDADALEQVLATGMIAGMEASYGRLERDVLGTA